MAGIDKYFWRGIKEDMAKIVKMMATMDEFSHLDVPRVTAWICSDAVTVGPRMRTVEKLLSSLIPGKDKHEQLLAEIGATAQKDLAESFDSEMKKFNEVSAKIVQQEAARESERLQRQTQAAQKDLLAESFDPAMKKSNEVSARIVQYRAAMEAERVERQAQAP
jgi:hypothetical protein